MGSDQEEEQQVGTGGLADNVRVKSCGLESGEKPARSSRKDRVLGTAGFPFFKWRRMSEKNVGVKVA